MSKIYGTAASERTKKLQLIHIFRSQFAYICVFRSIARVREEEEGIIFDGESYDAARKSGGRL